MGTGRKRAGDTPTKVTTRATTEESLEGTEVGNPGQTEPQNQLCWDFRVENPVMRIIREVTVGTVVQGQPLDSTVLVTSPQHGALGRAPESVGRKIIKAQQDNGGRLGGKVMEHLKTTVKVRLCLE